MCQQITFLSLAEYNFKTLAGLTKDEDKLKPKHYIVIIIAQILKTARQNNWGLCIKNGFVYLYNGTHWCELSSAELQTFLGESAENMGFDKYNSRFYAFRDQLSKQFLAAANLPKPDTDSNVVLLNLLNGTMEVGMQTQTLRAPQQKDFLTYLLPFEYNDFATAPKFQAFLDRVQPDVNNQLILAEFLAYLFVKSKTLKLEKTLLLYGGGANGKSVFFEIVNALLGGNENVCSYSLQSLTDDTGYFRAKLANKLVNYASEISGKLQISIFKQLVSGEPVEARLPYGEPFTLTDYAKLIFNCNGLPQDTEQTHAFFRRFLIVPFNITIPEMEQNKSLAAEIISTELSGVFNWVLDGLKRLLKQKDFTVSEAVNEQIEQYKVQSDSVKQFLNDEGYMKSAMKTTPLKHLFYDYRKYCEASGYRSCSIRTVGDRLKNAGFVTERKNYGMAVYAEKPNDLEAFADSLE